MNYMEYLNTHRTALCAACVVVLLGVGSAVLYPRITPSGQKQTPSTAQQEAFDLSHADFRSIEAEYTGTAYEGERFDTSRVRVYAMLTNGKKIDIKTFDVDGSDSYGGTTDYTILTPYGTAELTIHPVLIDSVRAEDGSYFAGNEFTGNLILNYQDGTTRTIKSSEVTFPEGCMMHGGTNSIPFLYEDCRHTLYVNAAEGNFLSDAKETYKDELARSIYNSVSDRMFLTVSKETAPIDYYITHVILSDPSGIRIGTTGSYLSPSAAAASFQWVLGMNASDHTQLTDASLTTSPYFSGCVIRNGNIVTDGTTTGYEICLTSEGALFSPPDGITAQQLIDQKVTDTLVTQEPLLLQDGHTYEEGTTALTGTAPISVIGMVKPGEYYLLSTEQNGLTAADLQNIFRNLGCAFARPVGRGRSALYYKTTPICISSTEAMQDFLYFS